MAAITAGTLGKQGGAETVETEVIFSQSVPCLFSIIHQPRSSLLTPAAAAATTSMPRYAYIPFWTTEPGSQTATPGQSC